MTLGYFYRFFLDDSLSTSKFQGTISKEGRLSYPLINEQKAKSFTALRLIASEGLGYASAEHVNFKALSWAIVQFSIYKLSLWRHIENKKHNQFSDSHKFSAFRVFNYTNSSFMGNRQQQPPKEALKRSLQKKKSKIVLKMFLICVSHLPCRHRT